MQIRVVMCIYITSLFQHPAHLINSHRYITECVSTPQCYNLPCGLQATADPQRILTFCGKIIHIKRNPEMLVLIL